MRDPERFARQPVEEIPRDRLPRGVCDRVHQAVESVPALAEAREEPVDLSVGRHVAGKDDVAPSSAAISATRSWKRSLW
jgi:hypothetical protein